MYRNVSGKPTNTKGDMMTQSERPKLILSVNSTATAISFALGVVGIIVVLIATGVHAYSDMDFRDVSKYVGGDAYNYIIESNMVVAKAIYTAAMGLCLIGMGILIGMLELRTIVQTDNDKQTTDGA